MKKFLMMWLLWGVIVVGMAPQVKAGELDILLNKLVDKGVLSPVEATIIRDETSRAVSSELSTGRSYAVPSWVQNLNLKQDLRLRYQYERKRNDTDARSRGRIRYRLGLDSKIVDKVKIGVGMATGGNSSNAGDPRSTNQTLENAFSKPDVRLDYAYAEYTHNPDIKAVAGKFKFQDYLWTPTDMLWDSDITTDGFSTHLQQSVFDNVSLFLNGGLWILDENGKTDQSDPYMGYTQTGLMYETEKMDAVLAGVFYGFKGMDDTVLDNSSSSNSLTASGDYENEYNSFGVSTEIGFAQPFGGLPYAIDERVALIGDFIHNPDPKDNGTGWAFGAGIGNKKVSDPGSWQLKYLKVKLGKDAFPDSFPDSDRLGGATDIKGHEVMYNYALKKNVILGLDYYNTQRIVAAKNAEHLLQADVLFKF